MLNCNCSKYESAGWPANANDDAGAGWPSRIHRSRSLRSLIEPGLPVIDFCSCCSRFAGLGGAARLGERAPGTRARDSSPAGLSIDCEGPRRLRAIRCVCVCVRPVRFSPSDQAEPQNAPVEPCRRARTYKLAPGRRRRRRALKANRSRAAEPIQEPALSPTNKPPAPRRRRRPRTQR
jgi:hypothetical protein